MRILILGGTVFLGRALTDAALAAGHDVTHFHRGKSAPDDARVATVHGDRTVEPFPDAIAKPAWDAVLDTSGYLPQVVARSARALAAARRYVFVSSISAYAGTSFGEDGPLAAPPHPLPEAMTPETYGGLKAACERTVVEAFQERSTIVRPGLIVGPHDPTDRFTYWPVRVARGGVVAAPGRPSRTVQFIDVRDVADFTLRLAAEDRGGIYNVTGPETPIAMATLLATCRDVSGSDASFAWLDEGFLEREKVQPWKEMPLWVPESDPHAAGFMDVPLDRARGAGLACRPLEETIADTLAWARTRPASHAWKAGLAAEREKALLERAR